MQQEENHRQDHQKEDRKQLLAKAYIKDRPAVDKILAQDLDRLQSGPGAEDHADKDCHLERVEHEGVDVQLGDSSGVAGSENRRCARA